jgi:hypothetical protein
MDENLRLNDLMTVGTHNSYKRAIPPADYRLIHAMNPKVAQELDYAHKDLTAQLNAGARQIEIDVVYDPQGGVTVSPSSRQGRRQHSTRRGARQWNAPVSRCCTCPMSISGPVA